VSHAKDEFPLLCNGQNLSDCDSFRFWKKKNNDHFLWHDPDRKQSNVFVSPSWQITQPCFCNKQSFFRALSLPEMCHCLGTSWHYIWWKINDRSLKNIHVWWLKSCWKTESNYWNTPPFVICSQTVVHSLAGISPRCHSIHHPFNDKVSSYTTLLRNADIKCNVSMVCRNVHHQHFLLVTGLHISILTEFSYS